MLNYDEVLEELNTYDEALLSELLNTIPVEIEPFEYDDEAILKSIYDIVDEALFLVDENPDMLYSDIVAMVDIFGYFNPVNDPIELPEWKQPKSTEEPSFPPEWDIFDPLNPIYEPNDPNSCFLIYTLHIDVPQGALATNSSNKVVFRIYYKNSLGEIGILPDTDVELGTIIDTSLYTAGFLADQISDEANLAYFQDNAYLSGYTNEYICAAMTKKDFLESIQSVIESDDGYWLLNIYDQDGSNTPHGVVFVPDSYLITYLNQHVPMLPEITEPAYESCLPHIAADDTLDIILYDNVLFGDVDPNYDLLYRNSPVEKYNIDRTSDSSYKYTCIDIGLLYSGFYKTLLTSCSFVKTIDRVLFEPTAFLQLPYFKVIDDLYIESYLLLFNPYEIEMDSKGGWTTTIPSRTFNNLLIPFVIENLLLRDVGGSYSILDAESLNELTIPEDFLNRILPNSGFRSIIMDCTPKWTTRAYYDYINIVEVLFRKE